MPKVPEETPTYDQEDETGRRHNAGCPLLSGHGCQRKGAEASGWPKQRGASLYAWGEVNAG